MSRNILDNLPGISVLAERRLHKVKRFLTVLRARRVTIGKTRKLYYAPVQREFSSFLADLEVSWVTAVKTGLI